MGGRSKGRGACQGLALQRRINNGLYGTVSQYMDPPIKRPAMALIGRSPIRELPQAGDF